MIDWIIVGFGGRVVVSARTEHLLPHVVVYFKIGVWTVMCMM